MSKRERPNAARRASYKIEAILAEHFTYAQSMGVLAATVLIGGAIVISLGPEAHGVSFRKNPVVIVE